MNKRVLFVLALFTTVLLTGCGKADKLTCTNEQKYGTAVLKTETVVKFKNGYKSESKTTMEATFDSDVTAKSFAENYEKRLKDEDSSQSVDVLSVKQDKNTVIVKTAESKSSISKTKIKKDSEKEQLENVGFKCQ